MVLCNRKGYCRGNSGRNSIIAMRSIPKAGIIHPKSLPVGSLNLQKAIFLALSTSMLRSCKQLAYKLLLYRPS